MRAASVRRRLFVLASLSLALLVPACSKSSHQPVYPVHGQVLVDGRPVAQAIVTFHPAGAAANGLRPTAQTDDQGHFHLTSYAASDGAPEGEYAVTVSCFRALAIRNPSEGDENTRNVLPPRYANPGISQLRAVVTKGDNELAPFQLRAR